MSKGFPWIQFFPRDWVADTRALTLAAKGAWIDILAALHNSPTRGSMTLEVEAWARLIGSSGDEAARVLRELGNGGVAQVVTLGNGAVMVENRRMKREEKDREKNRQRVARHREKVSIQQNTPHDSEPETLFGNDGDTNRSQKPEARIQNNTTIRAEAAAPLRAEKAVDSSPVVMRFPVIGQEDPWPLHQSSVDQFRQTFPGVNVPLALGEAKLWCEVNRTKRKTARGMPKFLFAWLERRQNRGGGVPPPGSIENFRPGANNREANG